MISKRLIEASYFTKGFNTLLDVGTDHAFLPIFALRNNYVSFAAASDINEKPLMNAKKNISNLNIDLYLFDGIPETNADVISICGMGGELIIEILDKTLFNAKNIKRLILAPNTDTIMVRKYIVSNGFMLVDEAIVKEKDHYYEILVLEKGNVVYNEKELYFGPFLLEKRTNEFNEKYEKRLHKLLSIVNSVTDIVKKEEIEREIQLVEGLFK